MPARHDELLLDLLLSGERITAAHARDKFGIANFRARIWDLRQRGHRIHTETFAFKGRKRKIYFLGKEPAPVAPRCEVDLPLVQQLHKLWLAGDPRGKCADLRGADLADAQMRRGVWCRANFSRVNFERADLRYADFTGANFSGANLHRTKLTGATMTNAVMCRVFAAFVSFHKVNMAGVDLMGADMTMANLDSAIWGDDADSRLTYSRLRIVPDGEIVGWKKLRGGHIAKLLIPQDARRSNAFGRRCRAEKVKVLSIISEDGKPVRSGVSKYDGEFVYRVGEIVKADGWAESWQSDCDHGVHFFLTYEEAEAL